jgi:hypothetical protein
MVSFGLKLKDNIREQWREVSTHVMRRGMTITVKIIFVNTLLMMKIHSLTVLLNPALAVLHKLRGAEKDLEKDQAPSWRGRG